MTNPQPDTADRTLADEVRRIWNTNAEWWDDRIGDGNQFQLELIEPTTHRLAEIEQGTRVLDVGCGAGRLARQMAQRGAQVTAFDFSDKFIARAQKRTPPEMTNIDYHVIDATDEQAMLALAGQPFDGAVATMCLMDMANVRPLFRALAKMLRPGGWFVFSIIHPCFDAPGGARFAESRECDGRIVVETGVKIGRYLTPTTWKGLGIVGQPEPHYYFHRPLSVLLGMAFECGLLVDALEEPGLKPDADDARYLRRDAAPEIPPLLIVRMRTKM